MALRVEIAKRLMNLAPNKPTYDDGGHFIQEAFRNEAFLQLSEDDRQQQLVRWVAAEQNHWQNRPFYKHFPDFPFESYFPGKSVLDLGCSIGSMTVDFAERWNVANIHGIDVTPESIEAAQLFVERTPGLKANYGFSVAYAEDLPFEDNQFDAVVSSDTLEHVRDVRKSLENVKRVTKPGGIFLLVFPSFYCPLGGAHLDMVTRLPFLEWVFSPKSLNQAYNEIMDTWGEEDEWLAHQSDDTYGEWAEVTGGIGINGITYRRFEDIVHDIGFSKVEYVRNPVFSVGVRANRSRAFRTASKLIGPWLRIASLRDYLSHRLVYRITI